VPKFVEQLRQLWNSLSARQRISLLVAAAGVAISLWGLQRWAVERNFKPLYTDMSSEEAGAVVVRLREMGVPYRINDAGTAVSIPSEQLAETRLQMATSGLPQHGRLGFELFDQTKFGATEFAEQVNFRRALEGELERSVLSLNQVEQARVHISLPKESVFLDYRQPAKASVVVKLRRAQRLETEQVRGVAYLVASAVEGLSPEMVSVLDVTGNLLSKPRRASPESGEELELREKIEREIAQKILHTVEPYLGPNKARASVSAEIELNAGEQTEEVIDPNPVIMAKQTSEEQSQPSWVAGPPGTASNVPRGVGRPGAGGNALTRKTESSTYQVSKTVTRMRLERGGLKRLSVAVLVDHRTVIDGAGRRILTPRPPQEMKTIRDLIVAAAGILEQRGDLLTVENLPFEGPEILPPAVTSPVAAPSTLLESLRRIFAGEWFRRYRYVVIGLLVGLILAGAAFLFWRRTRKGKSKAKKAEPPSAASQVEGTEERLTKQLADLEAAQREADEQAMLELTMPQVTSSKAMVLRKMLAETAKKDPQTTVQLLRSWIHENER
jgi:flagellar M-ring protein FliF